ncbi:MAG: hypothetical protein CM15mP18_4180 [Methanobacteriota archaeon]|nr:MAG: hypothetical protein CM15mP18_4180 [Euryarchaeota archaeon]
MRERTGCDYVMWHSTASLGVNRLVGEEDTLAVGAHTVRFHHAPGHTNDSMIVDVAGHIMTGDFLFTGDGGVGRDDLPSGRVDEHWEALSVLSRFPGEAIVLHRSRPTRHHHAEFVVEPSEQSCVEHVLAR